MARQILTFQGAAKPATSLSFHFQIRRKHVQKIILEGRDMARMTQSQSQPDIGCQLAHGFRVILIYMQLDLMADAGLRGVEFCGRREDVQVVAHNPIGKATLLQLQGMMYRVLFVWIFRIYEGNQSKTTTFVPIGHSSTDLLAPKIDRFDARGQVNLIDYDILAGLQDLGD